MAKSMKKSMKKSTKKSMKKSTKKSNRTVANKRTSKKRGVMRKNIKRVSLKNKNFSIAHKRRVRHYRHKALHNSPRGFYGGRKERLCECGCGRNCGPSCGCGPMCGCSCSRTRKQRKMKGGMVSSPAAGPVGYSWKGENEATWPGVAASHGINTNGTAMSNHFAVSPNGIVVGGVDLARSTSDDHIIVPPMNGGRKRVGRRGKKGQNGGFFQEIVNLGRGVQDGINGGYFNLIGKQQPISQNPYPTEQPLATGRNSTYIGSTPLNVDKIYEDANNTVVKV
jgi:hypothetical protein